MVFWCEKYLVVLGVHSRRKYQRIQINLSARWSNIGQNTLRSFANSQTHPVASEKTHITSNIFLLSSNLYIYTFY